jgi:Na+/proline symporter
MLVSRLSVAAVVALAVAVALYLPERIFDRVLFAWVALGSAFGPLVFVRLAGGTVTGTRALGSVWTGFVLAVALSLAPSAPGDIAERVLPFAAALAVLLTGSRFLVSAGPPGAG